MIKRIGTDDRQMIMIDNSDVIKMM